MAQVHIVPVAREVDRAVVPILGQAGTPPMECDRAILLVPPTTSARRIAGKVGAALEAKGIPVERHELATDADRPTGGLLGVLQQVAWLLQRETMAGHHVHVNLSSGSKLVAFAAGLACMAHLHPGTGTLYYVQYEGFSLSADAFEEHGHTRGVQSVERVELLPLALPDPVQQLVLDHLRHAARPMAYRDILRMLEATPGSGYQPPPARPADATSPVPLRLRDWSNASTTRMVRAILRPLVDQGLVEVAEAGRQRAATITSRGAHYAALAGVPALALRAMPGPGAPVQGPARAPGRPHAPKDAQQRPAAPARAVPADLAPRLPGLPA